ncbi:hypothetical protein FF1_004571 [Malus domestica]
MRGIFEGGLDNVGENVEEDCEEAADADWGEELDLVDVDNIPNGDISAVLDDEEAHEENEEGGWDLEDLELPPEIDTPKTASNARSSAFVASTPGKPVSQIWSQKSSLAAEHAAAGNFDIAMRLLSRNIQIAVASAKEIDEKDHWYRLGVEALRQGNAGIVEYCNAFVEQAAGCKEL